MEYREFDPDAGALNRAMAQGHQKRHGHPLTGYYKPLGDTGIGFGHELIRTCCNEAHEENAGETW